MIICNTYSYKSTHTHPQRLCILREAYTCFVNNYDILHLIITVSDALCD